MSKLIKKDLSMLSESYYWKTPLIQYSERLERFKKRKILTEKALAEIERNILIGFYSVRKLIETEGKITDKTKSIKINVEKYKNKNIKRTTFLNSDKIDELFELNNSTITFMKLLDICNQFIHSYILTICVDENNKFQGVFVSSDYKKNCELYFVKIDSIISIFKNIGNDYPLRFYAIRNVKGDFIIQNCK
ncbi:MAG: hypothetical protein ACYDIA_23830 [Candidatus Humimicrobiaceae bacterium]